MSGSNILNEHLDELIKKGLIDKDRLDEAFEVSDMYGRGKYFPPYISVRDVHRVVKMIKKIETDSKPITEQQERVHSMRIELLGAMDRKIVEHKIMCRIEPTKGFVTMDSIVNAIMNYVDSEIVLMGGLD